MDSTGVVQSIQSVTAELDTITQALQPVQSIPAGLDTVAQAMQIVATELDSIAQTLRAGIPWQTYLLPGCQVLVAVVMAIVVWKVHRYSKHRDEQLEEEKTTQRRNLVQSLFRIANREIDRVCELHTFLYVGGDGPWSFPVEFFHSLFFETAKLEPHKELSRFAEEFVVQLGFMQALRDRIFRMEETMFLEGKMTPGVEQNIIDMRHRIAVRMVSGKICALSGILNDAIVELQEHFCGIREFLITPEHLQKQYVDIGGWKEIERLAEKHGFALACRLKYYEEFRKQEEGKEALRRKGGAMEENSDA